MPAGVTWPQYLKFVAAASISMLLGAQCVHSIYRPLDDLDELVQKEIERLKQEEVERLKAQVKNLRLPKNEPKT